MTRWSDLGPEDKIDLELSHEQRELLHRGLSEWAGPTVVTDALAKALGYADRAMLHREQDRLSDEIALRLPLNRRDWARVLVALEVVWSSDFWGAAHEWPITTGWDDERTLSALRELQRTHFAGLRANCQGVDILDDPSEPAPPGHVAAVAWPTGRADVRSAAELVDVVREISMAAWQSSTRAPVTITIEGAGTLTSVEGPPPGELTYTPEGGEPTHLPVQRWQTSAVIRYFFMTGALPT